MSHAVRYKQRFDSLEIGLAAEHMGKPHLAPVIAIC